MKIYSPYQGKYTITQKFLQNFNPYYKKNGQIGHTGWDITKGYLTPISACIDAYCYSIINENNPDLNRYRAVYTLVEDAGVWYELSYGHLANILVKPQTHIKLEQIIGTEGNTGNVFVGGKPPTLEQKKKGAGSHLHLQLRLVKPVDSKTKGKKYLRDAKGDLKFQDKFWEIPLYDNGVNGCVDLEPFWYNTPKAFLTATLKYGMRGEQVKLLQKILKIDDDGIFGMGTENAVKAFQTKHKLLADGIVGNLTRNVLNQI